MEATRERGTSRNGRDDSIVDVIIVGAGPAGLGAALYTARAGLETIVFGDPYKGQLARAGIIENYLTWMGQAQGLEIVEKMVAHVEQWGARLDDRTIRQIVRVEDCFQLLTMDAESICAYAVIIATGAEYRKLGIVGEDDYYGKGVAYCTICEGPLYRGRPVAVVGHGDEAALAALRMSELASRVYMVANRPRLGATPELMERLAEAPNLSLYEGTKPVEVLGDGDKVTRFRFRRQREQHGDEHLDVDALFVEVGTMPSTTLASDLGLELEGAFIKVDREQRTNVPGIFAAGDLTGGQARQAAVSAGDGTRAAIAAIDYIKSLGLSAEKSRLKSVQWGAASLAPKADITSEAREQEQSGLLAYIAADPGFQRVYERYNPNEEAVEEIGELQPEARVIIVSATWCPDCRRNVPRWARIMDRLPGWTNEIFAREDTERAQKLGIRAIPTFIIYDPDSGEEVGRIVENPVLGSLEADIVNILRAQQAG